MESKENLELKIKELNGAESSKWVDSLETMLRFATEQNPYFLEKLWQKLAQSGLRMPKAVNTPYVNTIPPEQELEYPGDWRVERRIKSYIRWNAMAMVVNANRKHKGLGGHISTFASSATLYEVAYNHFFRGDDDGKPADIIYFQGHALQHTWRGYQTA